MIKVEKINGNLCVEMKGNVMELGAELFEATKTFHMDVAKKDKMLADLIVDANAFLAKAGEKPDMKELAEEFLSKRRG